MPLPAHPRRLINPVLAMYQLSTRTLHRTFHRTLPVLRSVVFSILVVGVVVSGCTKPASDSDAQSDNSAQDATAMPSKAWFVSPSDGDTVPSTFEIEMAVEGMAVEPAGEIRENSGHFHVIIDAPYVSAGEVVPTDDNHKHFGTGVSVAELTLSPGTHTLRLQFANGAHIAYDPAEFGQTISVTVE